MFVLEFRWRGKAKAICMLINKSLGKAAETTVAFNYFSLVSLPVIYGKLSRKKNFERFRPQSFRKRISFIKVRQKKS